MTTWTTRQAEKFVQEWKATHPCVDCSDRIGSPVFYPAYQLEFDHVGPKRATLGYSRHLRKLTEEDLLNEIAMCDLLCANCHREREHARRMVRRLLKRTE